MKNKNTITKLLYFIAAILVFNTEILAALPTKLEGVTINENDIIGTFWSLFKTIMFYGSWGAAAISLFVGGYNIIGAMSEARKKQDNGLLWTTVVNTFVVTIVLVIIAILITTFVA